MHTEHAAGAGPNIFTGNTIGYHPHFIDVKTEAKRATWPKKWIQLCRLQKLSSPC